MPKLLRSPIFQRWARDAIRAGNKMQTRRVAKPQPAPEFLARGVVAVVPQWPAQDGVRWFMADGLSELRRSPHGRPGDVWGLREPLVRGYADIVQYADDDENVYRETSTGASTLEAWQWKRDTLTSLFMPLWAARTFRTITDVHVERVQDISEADAIAEGLADAQYHPNPFAEVWDRINGKKPGCAWADNPWNFVYTFRPATADEVESAKGTDQ